MSTTIANVWSILLKERYIQDISAKMRFFYDEPSEYVYSGLFTNRRIRGAGASFFSSEEALTKTIAEGVERICLSNYNPSEIVKGIAPFPSHFPQSKSFGKSGEIGLVPGLCLTDSREYLLPAQLTSLTYADNNNEYKQYVNISTGAAFGFNLASSLLNGIYEIIERDAFMTIYLNKISAPQIRIEQVTDKNIIKIIQNFQRYSLKWYVFDFTTDLGIPVAVSLLIDKSGYGPSSSFGAKCSFDQTANIIGSAEEALMIHNSERIVMNNLHSINKVYSSNRYIINKIKTWWPQPMLKHLSFMFDARQIAKIHSKLFKTKDEELKYVVNLLKTNGHSIYYKDITLNEFKLAGCYVTKSIIPTLQPLYLGEENKYLHSTRLSQVAKFFNTKKTINKIPHPFL